MKVLIFTLSSLFLFENSKLTSEPLYEVILCDEGNSKMKGTTFVNDLKIGLIEFFNGSKQVDKFNFSNSRKRNIIECSVSDCKLITKRHWENINFIIYIEKIESNCYNISVYPGKTLYSLNLTDNPPSSYTTSIDSRYDSEYKALIDEFYKYYKDSRNFK